MTGILNMLVGVGAGSSVTIPLDAQLTTDYVFGGFPDRKGTATTDQQVGVTATGGVEPYTYLWEYVSGDTGIYAGTPTNRNTYFYRSFNTYEEVEAIWKCTVTDALSTEDETVNLTVYMYGGI